MVKKIVSPLFTFFALLFLLPLTTYADTLTYTIPQSVIDFTFEHLEQMKNTAENWLSSQHNVGGYSQYYIINYRPSNGWVGIYFYPYADENGNVFKGNSYVFYTTNNNYYLHFHYTGTMYSMQFNDDFTGFTSTPYTYNSLFLKELYTERYLLYFNFDLKYVALEDLLFTYDNQSYLYTNNSSHNKKFISVSELLTHFDFDPYPLIATFFTTVSEKLILITEYFSSNYIYLYIFAIFIIYFIILMFRRLS